MGNKTSNTSNQPKSEGATHCGGKPKKLSIGIAPLGIISIGIVPMGIVTIGIVPMGIVSVGVVAMGVINASIVGMGIFSVGVTTMGLKVWSLNEGNIQQYIKKNETETNATSPNILIYPTKSQAEKEAKKIGCLGVHKMGDYWMPCATHINTQGSKQ